jgi:competence ComEA-like helix-hairpin-helix protein
MQFTKGERRGLVLLSVLIVALVVANQLAVTDRMFTSDVSDEELKKAQVFMEKLDSLEQRVWQEKYPEESNAYPKRSRYKSYKKRSRYSSSDRETEAGALFEFDPNTLDAEGWKQLGFSQKQAEAMVKYIAKAGPFTKAEDLLRLFTVDSARFERLKPYVVLEKSDSAAIPAGENQAPLLIRINSATAEDFDKLPGIGKTYASRIVKYRDVLGGYLSVEQVSEVYGMRPGLMDTIRPFLELDEVIPAAININTCKAGDLKKHPYCNDWKIANAIVDQRDRFGYYRKLEDILKVPGITREFFDRIKPYLSLK